MDFCPTAPASLLERYLQEKPKTKSGKCYLAFRLVLKSLTRGMLDFSFKKLSGKIRFSYSQQVTQKIMDNFFILYSNLLIFLNSLCMSALTQTSINPLLLLRFEQN